LVLWRSVTVGCYRRTVAKRVARPDLWGHPL